MNIVGSVSKDIIKKLKSGDILNISGTIYTARDAAHKRLVDILKRNGKLPIELKNSIIYYTGPSPTRPGNIVGSIGPTTSYRMDMYTPMLLEEGVSVTIGKGKRGDEVKASMKENKSIYCAAFGGAGSFLASKVKSITPVAFKDLGPEAIYKLEVENFPVIVVNDIYGNDLYENRGDI